METPIIGIVGGVGPYAGLDLNRKIFDNTLTSGADQDHLEVMLFSAGKRVTDRTEYLLGREERNPAGGLFEALCALESAGASLAAIACNTAHSDRIIGPLKQRIQEQGLKIKLVDMIQETASFIRDRFGPGARAGLLATEGTMATGVYDRLCEESPGQMELVKPSAETVQLVHQAIYDKSYGIKAFSNPVTDRARADCRTAVEHLARKGAKLVILGCTELPLALPQRSLHGVELVDPTEITARAMIRLAAPHKLKPLTNP